MSDFVESAKNFVNAAVSRTSWEAQKQLRVRSKQSEIDALMEQRQKLLGELTQAALSLYEQGALSDANLSRLCASIIELDHDAGKRNEQLQEIKKENYPADQFAPAPTSNYAPPPVNATPYNAQPHQQPIQPHQQPTPPPSAAQPQMMRCPSCGNEVRVGSLYCRSCGAKLR